MNISNEYRNIIGFPRYVINDEGNVYFISKKRGLKKRKAYIGNVGYFRIVLSKNSIKYNKSVHRLVAEAFIPNPNNLPQINHKDGNKLNNSVSNLEWISSRGNQLHALNNKLYNTAVGESYHRSNLVENDIIEIRKLWDSNLYTQLELGNIFKTTKSTINHIVNRYTWRHL